MPEITGVVFRWLAYAATVIIGGVAVFPLIHRRQARLSAALPGSAVLLLLTAAYQMWTQVGAFASDGDLLGTAGLLLTMPWGWAWLAQVVVCLALLSRVGRSRRVRVACAVVLAAVPAMQGHAMGSERLTALAITADVVHVCATALWIGSLAALVLEFARLDDVGHAGELVGRFSPWALGGVALLGITGTFAAWLHVGTWQALFGSSYGRVLLIKLGAVVAVGVAGFVNWRVITPGLGRPGGLFRLRRMAAAELILAAVVLVVTAILTVTALPGE